MAVVAESFRGSALGHVLELGATHTGAAPRLIPDRKPTYFDRRPVWFASVRELRSPA